MADVSIIIPAYCKSVQDLEWLDDCLTSVKGQANEIVVWDDGSLVDITATLDAYPEIVRGVGSNKGVSAARNSAVRLARSDLIFPVDCDDVLVPNAISILLDQWTGVPLYPDLYKFGITNIPHYQLLDFSCDHLATKVGIAGVGVLHSKEQWKSVGGWNEQLDFYEDGEYNARLFLQHCAVHVKKPLYGYRTHSNQRTKLNAKRSVPMMRRVLSMVQKYRRGGVMGCPGCGSRRTGSAAPNVAAAVVPTVSQQLSLSQRVASLPGAQGGKVHARYIGGKGKGRHYYQGPGTKHLYKVMHDDLVINVDPRDTSDPSNPGHAQVSMLVRIAPPPPPPKPFPLPEPEPLPAPDSVVDVPLVRGAKRDVVREAVEPAVVEDLGIYESFDKVPYRELVTLDLTQPQAKRLLEIELAGRGRKKHTAYLRRRVGDK